MGFEEEEVAGRCAAILTNGRRCPNAALAGSRYCGLPAHQALEGTGTDQVGAESAEAPAADAAESAEVQTAEVQEEAPAVEETEAAEVAEERETAEERAS